MIEYILIFLLLIDVATNLYRIRQFRKYTEQNRRILSEMSEKQKDFNDVTIKLTRLFDLTE